MKHEGTKSQRTAKPFINLLLTFALLAFGGYTHAQKTNLTIKDVQITVMKNTNISVNGNLRVMQSSTVKYGEILNSGNLYVTDSIINQTDKLFSKTSNPYLSNGNPSTSAGTVIFNGTAMQPIKSKKPNRILFHNMDISNASGVKLNDSITALGMVNPKQGSMFLNGKNLYLFYGTMPYVKYDGYLGKETNSNKIWDNTKVGNFKLLNDRRSGHIVAKYQDKPSFDSMASTIGITIEATSLHVDTFQRGHLSLPYAGNGSIRKYFVLKTKGDSIFKETYKITYLDSSDFENLHIKEPDFRLFQNQNNSPVTYAENIGAIDIVNHIVSGDVKLLSGRQNILTIADSACVNPPTAKLKANANVCRGVPFTITTDSLVRTYSDMVYYSWYKNGILLGDTSNIVTDTLKTPVPTIAIYKVKIYDNRGCFSFSSVTVTSHPIPTAFFKKDDKGAGYCAGSIATFTDSSYVEDNKKLTRTWFWSDGMQFPLDSAKIITHTFNTLGTYSVSMISTSIYGCSDTIIKDIEIHPIPVVNFGSQKLCGDSSLWVHFNNLTDPVMYPIYKADWKFGATDSLTLYEGDNPSMPFAHQFTSTGLKTVKLTINSQGCVTSFTDTVRVSKQTVNFSAASVCLYHKTIFQNLSTIESATPIYTWKFGDGTFSNEPNPQKAYLVDGTYDVTLYMQSDNCTDSVTKTISVYPLPGAIFTTTSACLGASVTFNPSDKTGKIYNWNIAGVASQDVSPNKVFTTAGRFDVSLSVTSVLGCIATSTAKFDVYARPKAEFTFQNVCLGNPVQFYNQSAVSGGSLASQWTFEDDDPSTASNPVFTFGGQAGNKNVMLIATSNHNCSDTIEKMVEVYPLPFAGMATPISYCEKQYTLDATVLNSVATVSTYTWNNGTRLPQLTVVLDGTYSVDIVSNKGCQVTESVRVTLNSSIKPGLPNDTSFCGKGTLDAKYADARCTWYKDGNEIVTKRKLLVNESGWYKVIVNDQVCSGSDSVYVTKNPAPQISLGNNITECTGTPVFLDAGTGFSAYQWSTGETENHIAVISGGRYKVTVTNTYGCSSADTIKVSYLPVPAKPLPETITQCSSATIDAGDNASSFLWSNGATSNTINVNTSGNYWVKVSNGYQCFTYDTINVNILLVDRANLGSDVSVCEGAKVTLDAGVHDVSYSFLWNKQTSTSHIYQVTKAGRYIVELLNTANGCFSFDTIFVQFKPSPRINLGSNKALCNALSVVLDAGNPGALTQWSSSGELVGTQQTFEVKEPGKYRVMVMNESGCIASDSIQIYPSSASLVAEFIAASRVSTGDTVNFRDMSYPEPYTCKWKFGDGVQSTLPNPSHIFYIADTFRVTLTVDNTYCTSVISKPISVKPGLKKSSIGGGIANENFIEILSSNLYPNPTSGEFTFEMKLSDYADVMIAIFDMKGSLISIEKPGKIVELTKNYSLSSLKPGIYIFKASVGKNAVTYKIVKY